MVVADILCFFAQIFSFVSPRVARRLCMAQVVVAVKSLLRFILLADINNVKHLMWTMVCHALYPVTRRRTQVLSYKACVRRLILFHCEWLASTSVCAQRFFFFFLLPAVLLYLFGRLEQMCVVVWLIGSFIVVL